MKAVKETLEAIESRSDNLAMDLGQYKGAKGIERVVSTTTIVAF